MLVTKCYWKLFFFSLQTFNCLFSCVYLYPSRGLVLLSISATSLWDNEGPQSQVTGGAPVENLALPSPWHSTSRDFGFKYLLEAKGKKHMNTTENNKGTMRPPGP